MKNNTFFENYSNVGEPSFNTNTTLLEVDGIKLETSLAQISVINNRSAERKLPQGDIRNLHFHLCAEFFLVYDDEMLLITEKESYKFKNSVVCVPAYLNHYAVFSGKANAFSVGINENVGLDGLGLIPHFTELAAFPLDDETLFYIKHAEASINSDSDNEHRKTAPFVTLLMFHLFDLANINFANRKNKSASDFLRYVKEIEVALADIYTGEVKLSTLAKRLFLSEKQVARIIKKAYNATLSDLILNKKMAVAARLLSDNNKRISEIAKELNFKSESHFFVQFKKKYGCTPLSYRKKHLSK